MHARATLEAVCADPGETVLDELESLVDKALVQMDGQDDRLRMLQTIGEYADERLEASGRERHAALQARTAVCRASPARSATASRVRDQVGSLERGIAEEGNLQAALDTLLAAWRRDGDAAACEAGLQLCGDLLLYWHIRGKNLTAREYAAAFLEADVDCGSARWGGRAR